MDGVNVDGVMDRFKGLLELQKVLSLEVIEARFTEHDLMEHSILRDDDPEMYQGEYVYEQMSLEEFLKGEGAHDWN